jgi:hypothetical protein
VTDARPAATLAGLDRNEVLIVHSKEFSIIPGSVQQGFAGREGHNKLP